MTSVVSTDILVPRPKPRVVVVGAGFAGIAAAEALREGGVEDVLVLEAQDFAGGRVQKIQLDGGFVEPGAQFIHGEKGNKLYELAEQYSLLMDKSLYQGDKTADSSAEDYRSNQFRTSRGELLQQESVSQLVHVINRVFRDYANSFFAESGHNGTLVSQNKQATFDESTESNFNLSDSDATSNTNGRRAEHDSDTVGQKETSHNHGITTMDYKDCIIDYSGCTVDGDGKQEKTFTEVLKTTRQKILAFGEQPEEVKIAVLKWMEQWEYTDNGARLQEVSLPAYGKYAYLPGYGLTMSASGLKDIFNTFLAQSLPPQSLLLNKPVKTIYWAERSSENHSFESTCKVNFENMQKSKVSENGKRCNNQDNEKSPGVTFVPKMSTSNACSLPGHSPGQKPITVLCEDGEMFEADHVIVTSSMGYLKKHEAILFKPMLPEKYRFTIHQMGFGSVAKVFLIWDDLDKVLDPEVEGVQFLWLEGSTPQPPSDRTAKKTQRGGNWYDFLQGLERVPSHKGMLLTWLAGEEADIMETLPEQEVKDVLHELLMQFTNNISLPPPKQVVRSQWHSNPYVLGGYSYISAGMDPESHNLFSTPLPSHKNPLLQLSGEATSCRFYSSVHGAIDSGQRAARAILHHHNIHL